MRGRKLKGQALVETLLSLPLVVVGVTALLGGLHSVGLYYLGDHWTYQSALCLTQERGVRTCQKILEDRLHQLPFSSFQITSFGGHPGFSQVVVRLQGPLGGFQFREGFSGPLKSGDFEGLNE